MAVKKSKLLVKKIVRIGGIGAAVVVVISGLYFLAHSMVDSEAAKNKKTRSAIQQDRNVINQLTQLVKDAGLAGEIFARLSEDRNVMTFDVERSMLTEILAEMNRKYLLEDLNLELEASQPFEHSELGVVQRDTVQINFSISFGAMSDHLVYAFVDDLLKSTPGFLKIVDLKVERNGPMSVDTLTRISQGNYVQTVSAEMKFQWYGFKPRLDDEGEPNAAP